MIPRLSSTTIARVTTTPCLHAFLLRIRSDKVEDSINTLMRQTTLSTGLIRAAWMRFPRCPSVLFPHNQTADAILAGVEVDHLLMSSVRSRLAMLKTMESRGKVGNRRHTRMHCPSTLTTWEEQSTPRRRPPRLIPIQEYFWVATT